MRLRVRVEDGGSPLNVRRAEACRDQIGDPDISSALILDQLRKKNQRMRGLLEEVTKMELKADGRIRRLENDLQVIVYGKKDVAEPESKTKEVSDLVKLVMRDRENKHLRSQFKRRPPRKIKFHLALEDAKAQEKEKLLLSESKDILVLPPPIPSKRMASTFKTKPGLKKTVHHLPPLPMAVATSSLKIAGDKFALLTGIEKLQAQRNLGNNKPVAAVASSAVPRRP